MLDYTDLDGLKKITNDLTKIQKNQVSDVKYIKEDELDAVINLLHAIINTKEFNQRLK